MIGRRKLLSFLGLGSATAVAVSIPTPAEAKAALPMWVEQDGDVFNVRVQCADGNIRTLWRWTTEDGAPLDTVPLTIHFQKPFGLNWKV